MKIRIVTDSAANLFTSMEEDLVSVPLKIHTDVKEYVDDDHMDTKELTEDLVSYKGKSGSACPSAGEWLEAFGDAEYVIGVTITSNLSGSYNAAMVAKAEYESEYPDRKVYIIDTLSAGPEMRLIIEKIQDWIVEGKDFQEICKEISEYRKHTSLIFCLKSMRNLANNGRVSPVVAKIAGVLGIHAVGIASEQGTLEQKDKARGEKKALLSILKIMKELGYKGGRVQIDHCFNKEAALELKEKILALFQHADVRIGITKGLCSFYAEQGGLMVGFEH